MDDLNFNASFDEAINLLIIGSSLTRADEYTTLLRNSGYATHPTQVNSAEQFTEYLKNQSTDIIIFSHQETSKDTDAVLVLFEQSKSDASFIIVTDLEDVFPLTETMKRGVRDIVQSKNTTHFTLVIQREYNDLLNRRSNARLKQQLSESEERCGSLIQTSRDAIAYVHEGMHLYANSVYLELFGYLGEDDILGMPLLDLIAPDDLPLMKKFLRKQSSKTNANIEIHCRTSESNIFDAKLEFSSAHIDGELATQIIIRDQSVEKALDKKLQALEGQENTSSAFVNQDGFISLTDNYFAQPSHPDCFVAYLMLDNSEKLKHQVGLKNTEKLIQEIAQIIDSISANECTCSRIGDFSFGFLIENDSTDYVKQKFETLLSSINDNGFTSSSEFITPSASVGLVKCRNYPQKQGHEYIDFAISAMQTAKKNGGNQVSYYDKSVKKPTSSEQPTGDSDAVRAAQIKKALKTRGFNLVYQPIVSLQGDTRENYAVMIRLPVENEELYPDDFFPAAIKAGLMPEIDRWVIKNAVRELAIQRRDGRKINFFINISEAGIQDAELLLWVCDCLRENKAKGPWLTFQLKDHDIRSHIQDAKILIEGLRKIRCQIALDHFGRVKQSSSLLKHIDVDFIKLAPEFMDDLSTSQEKQDDLKQVNDLIHSFDLKSIATGVEDANSLALLWTSGINYIQGYFLQEPAETIAYDFNG